jgi:hypothetical protein
MPSRMDLREREARDIAHEIAVTQDTDVSPDEVYTWRSYDVYEWLAAWGYQWDDTDGWWSPNTLD